MLRYARRLGTTGADHDASTAPNVPLPSEVQTLANIVNDLAIALRAALRSLVREPVVTGTVVVTIGLGIGASTAMFSVVRGVLVHSVPYPRESELVEVTSTLVSQGITQGFVAFPRFEAYAAQERTFTGLVAYVTQDITATGTPTPVSVPGARISEGFLKTLGIAPIRGRDFTSDEQARGGSHAALIGERLWQGQFGGAEDILARTISIDGEAVPIVGVIPANLAPPLQDADILLPRVYEPDAVPPEQVERGAGYLRVMGRLQPGVTPAAALLDLQRVVADYRTRFGALRDASFDVAVVPLATYLFGAVRASLVFLWVAGMLVFLIACANAGNVQLARYLARRTELDIRSAMGATRAHVMLHLLTECAVLAAGGVAIGLLGAIAALYWLQPLAAQVLTTNQPFAIDASVFVVAAALGSVAIFVTGAIPALHATAEHPNAALASGTRHATGGRSATRWRRAFVVAQVAVSYALLSGALQQVAGLLALQRLDRGFDPAGLTAFRIAPSTVKYPTPGSRLELYRRIEAGVAELPGVSGVGASLAMPVGDDQTIAFSRELDQARKRDEWPHAQFRVVSPGFFGALGMTVLRGRGFTAFDATDATNVVVVNDTLARQYLGGTDAIGSRILLGSFPGPREVVGVVSNVPQRWLEREPLPEAYIPESQLPVRLPPTYFFVRSSVAPATLIPTIRVTVAAVDPAQSITRVRTMAGAVDEGLAIPRMRAVLIAAFALLGTVLAAVGLWSVMAQFAAGWARELAIRLALGAPPRVLYTHVVRAVLAVTVAGLAVGLAIALSLGRVTRHTFIGIESPGVPVLVGAGALLLAIGGLTAMVLARRAARVDLVKTVAG